jgi:hypothetical protein
MTDQDAMIEDLLSEIDNLKRKLEICEGYLKKVYDCDSCVHYSRSDYECEDNCKYEIKY